MNELHIKVGWDGDHYFADILESESNDNWFPRPAAGFPCLLNENNLDLAASYQALLTMEPGELIGNLGPTSNGLFEFLCGPQPHNNLFQYWTTCFGEADQAGEALRTVLHLDESRDELITAPWELMRNPANAEYTALIESSGGQVHSLIRTSWQPAAGFGVKKPVPIVEHQPLRILLVVGTDEVEAEKIQALTEVLGVDLALLKLLPWLVEFKVLRQPTLDILTAWCGRWRPHVFHFVGHGGFHAVANQPYVILQQSAGGGAQDDLLLMEESLGKLFDSSMPRLVILNACRSGQPAASRESRSRAGLGFAKLLIRRGILAVISMQADIQGEAAAMLMRHFYEGIVRGEPFDRALAAARYKTSVGFGGKWDWGLPALHLADHICADDVLALGDALSAPAGQDADFLASLKGRKDEVSGLNWPEAIRLRIGYENVRLDLEEKFLRSGANGRPVIITLAGEEQSGKTTLVYWLAASLARLGRQCIYADFGGDSLKYWEVLRLIRDGCLDSGIDADVAFNRFNHALNVRQVDGYEKAHPHPPAEGVAVAEEVPEADLALFMQETGTVEAEDDPLSAIIATFWSDLKRLSGEKGLVVFFDHVERMTLSEVQIIYRHLLRPALDAQDHKVQFVVVREISPYMTNLIDSWESLKQQNALLEHYILPGFPGQETLWFSRVWARRYYQLVCDYQLGQNNQLGHNNLIRAFLNQHPGVSLKVERLDDLLAKEPSLEPSSQPVPPGQIVDFLVGVKIVSRYLKKLTGE